MQGINSTLFFITHARNVIESVIIAGRISKQATKTYCYSSPHRGINADHGINVDQHSKPRNKCKDSIQYLHLFRDFVC
jgi:hypothetical protein